MKKVLFGCGGIAALGLLIIVVLGFTLSAEWEVEQSIVISAPSADIHAVLSDLRTWEEWSAWSKEADPTCGWTYTDGPGTGMHMEWKGDVHMQGEMTITSDDPASGMAYDMRFVDFDAPATGEFAYTPEGDGTRVTWSSQGSMGDGPFMGLVRIMMEPVLDQALELGLGNLKTRLEGGG